MTDQELEARKYPIGRFKFKTEYSDADRSALIENISTLPEKLMALAQNLSAEDLTKTYRPGSWNVQQMIHHIADSHMHSFLRFKFAMNEDTPIIKTYDENTWAVNEDVWHAPAASSLLILAGLHARWSIFLRSMKPSDFDRKLYNPEMKRLLTLNDMLALYAWHGNHHLAQIEVALGKR